MLIILKHVNFKTNYTKWLSISCSKFPCTIQFTFFSISNIRENDGILTNKLLTFSRTEDNYLSKMEQTSKWDVLRRVIFIRWRLIENAKHEDLYRNSSQWANDNDSKWNDDDQNQKRSTKFFSKNTWAFFSHPIETR